MEQNAREEQAVSRLPDISVVIPTFNRRDVVVRSLKALFEQDFPASNFEIIVVDDGSTDGTADEVRRLSAPCRMRLIEQENSGPGAARNAGVLAVESELILFLDDDMRCDAGLVRAHVEAHSKEGNVVGYGAVFADPESPPSLALECFKREIGAIHLKHAVAPDISWDETSCVFSNTSVPRRLLLDVKGFDTSFRVREDLELGVRLHAAGARPLYVRNAVAYQYYLKTKADLLAEAERFAVADVKFGWKYPKERIPGHLRAFAEERNCKARVRGVLVSSPLLERLLLSPPCILGEKFIGIGILRRLGVRTLQVRRRVRWLRMVRKLNAN